MNLPAAPATARSILLICCLALFSTLAPANASPSDGDGAAAGAARTGVPQEKSSHAARKRALVKELEAVRAGFAKNRNADAPKRLWNAEYCAYRTLAVIVRSLDKPLAFADEIDGGRKRFDTEDRARATDAGKIANGMSGIYEMYGLLYRMRFENDTARLRALEQMNDSVIARFTSGRPAIEALSVMAENMYRIAGAMLRDIDLRQAYTAEFNAVEEQYVNGTSRAESPEDRFLNGIYRTFELSQIWAMFLEPTTRKEIVEMNREMIRDNEKITTIESQLALGMEYFYRILDLVARRTVDVMF